MGSCYFLVKLFGENVDSEWVRFVVGPKCNLGKHLCESRFTWLVKEFDMTNEG